MSTRTKHPVTDVSAVVKANSKKANVIRTSIPASVRNALNLQAGDQLVWEIAADNASVFARVRRKQVEADKPS